MIDRRRLCWVAVPWVMSCAPEGTPKDETTSSVGLSVTGSSRAERRLAVEARYQRERELGQLAPAQRDMSQLPPLPVVEIPPPPEGIIASDQVPFPASVLIVRNRWQGMSDSQRVIVYAGAPGTDAEQGVLVVVRASGLQTWHPTPVKGGAVSVVDVRGGSLLVETDARTGRWAFDLQTLVFSDQPLDELKPTTNYKLSPEQNVNGWNRSATHVELRCTDDPDGSGVSLLRYSLSGASELEETSGMGSVVDLDVVAHGVTTVRFSCRDAAGNAEDWRELFVRIDMTPPSMSCQATPAVIWPPNRAMIDVAVAVNVSDDLSGSGAFSLLSVSMTEGGGSLPLDTNATNWIFGTDDTRGKLRADRSGHAAREYVLSYSGQDLAGNTALCAAKVAVPHDRR